MMHVALIADSLWLDEELPQFQAMVVGLIDEGVRVVQVVPDRLDSGDLSQFGEHVRYRESGFSLLQQYQLSRIRRPLDKLGVNLVHALSSRCWGGAMTLAKQMDVPAVLTASAAKDIEPATRLARQSTRLRFATVATTEPLGEAIRQRQGEAANVQVIPPGVHLGAVSEQPQPNENSLCAIVTGSGVMDEYYQALLDAITAIVRDHPQTQFFFDSQQRDQHALWQAARKLGILSNVSLVPRRPGHHEILLRADVVIQPQPLAQSRGMMLEAMAQGIAIIAATDPWLDYLLPDQTAWVVDGPNQAAWEQRLRDLVADRESGRALGRRAREWIGQTHVAADQVGRTLDLYRQISGESIKFEEAKQG